MDFAGGEYLSDLVFSDLDNETFGRLKPPAIHRSTDIILCRADAEGYVRAYIVLPTAVFGFGTGPLYDAGISKRPSVLVSVLANAAVPRGRSGIIDHGRGQECLGRHPCCRQCVSFSPSEALYISHSHTNVCRRGAHLPPLLRGAHREREARTWPRRVLSD